MLFLSCAACATTSMTRVGTASYPPLAPTAPVTVYSTTADVKGPFETLGIVQYVNPGKYQILTLDRAIPPLEAQARRLGANGLIIDDSQTTKSGIVSTGISVRARAIRVSQASAAPPRS